MGVRVRVRDFQSIEDATVVIEGLTVVTGANNSGKSALMRAIRGVFTNAPAGPLVRHGAAHLSVLLSFDDGTEILWEKGWEKPGRKGKTVNRYSINGKQIAGVGRGVPPEVEALGVREISAASDRIWPQIAEQFDGTLFLVNRPGSAVAEALSDVERVGKLSAALKASESDRRSVNSELKVRRKDAESQERRVEHYEGLDGVLSQGESLQQQADRIGEIGQKTRLVEGLRDRHFSATGHFEALASFDPAVVPDGVRAEKLGKGISKVLVFRSRWQVARRDVDAHQSFEDVVVPDTERVQSLRKEITGYRELAGRHRHAADGVEQYEGFSPFTGDTGRVEEIGRKFGLVSHLRSRWSQAQGALEGLAIEEAQVSDELAAAESAVASLLGDRGECPTCGAVHEGSSL